MKVDVELTDSDSRYHKGFVSIPSWISDFFSFPLFLILKRNGYF